ncbi:MAG: tetratricopeptide repeat protein [Candidatus Binatia bacterium]
MRYASPIVLLVLAVVIAAAYANSLAIGFQFDDWHVLEQNPFIRSLRSIPRFFIDAHTTTVLRENVALRPILMVSFAVNYAISGPATWSYHVVNIVLHWLAMVFIFRIVRDHFWFGDDGLPIAAGAALIVALHPLNTEPVDYLSARSALLTTVFYLAAFDLAVRGRRLPVVLLFVLALLTKEIAVTLPVALLGYWLVARQTTVAQRQSIPWRFLALLVMLSVAGVLYRILLLPPWAFGATHDAWLTPPIYFMTEWSAYLYYLRLFLLPNALVVDRLDYPIVHSLLQPQAWGSLLILLALLLLAWRARRRWPAVTFAAIWYFVTLAIESTFFPLAEPVNEHRPYLTMLALGTVASLGLWRLAQRWTHRHPAQVLSAYAFLLTLLSTSLGAATVVRNYTWRDDYSLWRDATEKAPNNARAWMNAGRAAMNRGFEPEARRFLLEARRLSPCYAYVQMNLSALEARSAQLEASLAWADEAVRCNPGLALTHFYRGAALERLNRLDEALQEYRETTAIDAVHTEAWMAQGRLLERRMAWQDAVAAYDQVLAGDPTAAEAAMRAGLVCQYHLANPARAVERYRAVLRLMPNHYGAHYQLALALLAAGNEPEARVAWKAFEPLAAAIGDRAALESAPAALADRPAPALN